MKTLVLLTLFAVSVSFTFSQISFAACGGGPTVFTCDDSSPNPDPTGIQESSNDANLTITVLPGAIIDTVIENGGNGNDGITTGNGNNIYTITDAQVHGDGEAIETGFGNGQINISGSSLSGGNAGIDTDNGNDTINLINSELSSRFDAFCTNPGDDVINIIDSTVSSSQLVGVDSGADDDQVTVINSTISSGPGAGDNPIELDTGNDTLTLGTNAVLLNGVIECKEGFDTIVFAMDVPQELLNFFSNQIALATVPDGSITIDGIFYEWTECELLVNDLKGVENVRPIPTLSEWGLIAMAGLIGIVGLIVVRRKNLMIRS